jgi:poly(hydroxyalkanoate) granule-associated protein
MTKRLHSATDSEDLFHQLKDLTEKFRLVGLGVFSKAQRTGGELLESLIEEGKKLEASFNPSVSRTPATPPLKPQQLEQLEKLFEDRVARALQHLRVPTRRELQALHRQMDVLSERIKALGDGSNE